MARSRRSIVLQTLGAALVAASLLASEPQRPNIILINADDLGYAGIGCYGQELIQTPHIDKMAQDGVRFTDFYSANTVCVPSRVGLLTGRHPGHASIRDNFPPPLEDFSGLRETWPAELWPPKHETLSRVLKRAGYRTAQFGKLEVGIPMAPGRMKAHGWDDWLGFRETDEAAQYYPLGLWRNDRLIRLEANRPEAVRRPGVVGTSGVYSEDLFVEEILKFIRDNKQRRFFVYFPTQVPHGRSPRDGDQIQVPDLGPYADREWTRLEKLYAAMITRFDGHVGRILGELEALGISRKTLVILTSDNGDENSYYEYTPRFHATGPLRGKKRYLYEGGIRVPMIARWPGTIGPLQTSSLPSAAWDLMPTLAELSGAARPDHADGVSLVPTLLGHPDRQQPREYLYWEYAMGKQQAVRMGRWKGVRFGGTKEPIELYDLAVDVGEEHNVADAHPDVVSQIREVMLAAREGSEFTRFWPLPDRRQYQLQWDKWIFDQLEHGIR